MSDATFEVKFSKLVDSALREKVPALMDYYIGFQIIDKNEEDTRAVGVSVFVVNNVWAYMPVFFINGALKGTDLLYVKQNDVFVPARDNWIASFKEQGAAAIGEAKAIADKASENIDEQGFDLQDSEPEQIKIASESLKKEFETIVDTFNLQKVSFSIPDKISLPEGLAALGPKAQVAFANTFMSSPEFANSVLQFHDVADILQFTEMFKKAAEEKTKDKEQTTVEIIADLGDEKAKSLSESEKKQLIRNGFFVKDERTNFSKVFNTRIDPGVLANPTYSGIYDILMRDGGFKPTLILFPSGDSVDGTGCGIEHADYPRRGVTHKNAYIISLDNSDYFTSDISNKMFVKAPSAETLGKMVGKNAGVPTTTDSVINRLRREASDAKKHDGPFATNSKDKSGPRSILEGGPGRCLLVQGMGKCIEVYMPYTKEFANDTLSLGEYSIKFTNKPGNLVKINNTVYCPSNARMLFELTWDKRKELGALGNLSTITSEMINKGSLRFLKVRSQNNTADITVDDTATGTIDKLAAVKFLSEKVGLYAGQAQQLLKEASRASSNTVEYFVKIAAPYDVSAYEGSAPFMGGPSAKKETAVDESDVEVGGKAQTNPDPKVIADRANRAAQAGIKEVFDTSVIKSLVDVADLSELRQDYLKDMIIGLDRVGRMLFLFYWHSEDFEDRYGKEDMDKLEDSLKKVFVSLGDLVLFLKEKTAYSPDSSESLFGSLSEDVGGAATTSASGM